MAQPCSALVSYCTATWSSEQCLPIGNALWLGYRNRMHHSVVRCGYAIKTACDHPKPAFELRSSGPVIFVQMNKWTQQSFEPPSI